MVQMSESGQQIAVAWDMLIEKMSRRSGDEFPKFDPQELIRIVSGGRNVGAYRAALQSLLSAGIVERAEGWTIRFNKLPDAN